MNQDSLKVSVFEPKFLQLVKFWRDIFTACQSLSQQFYHSSDFVKNFFKTRPILNQWCEIVSDLKPNIYNSSNFDSRILQRIRLWNNLFTNPQFLNQKNHKAPDFRKSLILGEQFSLEFRILKDNFWCNLHPKNETVGISVISWKSIFRERLFWRRNENNSRIKTSKASYIFFSISWQRVLSQIEKLKKKSKTSPTSGQFFGTRQKLNRGFYRVSENDTTISSPVSFWMEVLTFPTLKQKSFHKENLLEKEHIFYQNFREKSQILKQTFRTLQNANQDF